MIDEKQDEEYLVIETSHSHNKSVYVLNSSHTILHGKYAGGRIRTLEDLSPYVGEEVIVSSPTNKDEKPAPINLRKEHVTAVYSIPSELFNSFCKEEERDLARYQNELKVACGQYDTLIAQKQAEVARLEQSIKHLKAGRESSQSNIRPAKTLEELILKHSQSNK